MKLREISGLFAIQKEIDGLACQVFCFFIFVCFFCFILLFFLRRRWVVAIQNEIDGLACQVSFSSFS